MSGNEARDVEGGEKPPGGVQLHGFEPASRGQVYYSSDSQTYMKYGGIYENGHSGTQTGFYANSLQPTQVFTTSELPEESQTFQELTPVNPYQHEEPEKQKQSQHNRLTELRPVLSPDSRGIGETQQQQLGPVSEQIQTIGGSEQMPSIIETRQFQAIVETQHLQTNNPDVQIQNSGNQLQTAGGNQQQMQTISPNQQLQSLVGSQQIQTGSGNQQLQTMGGNQQQLQTISGNQQTSQLQIISGNQQQMHVISGNQQLQTVSANQQPQQLQTISGNQQQLQTISNQQQLQTIGGTQQQLQTVSGNQQQLRIIGGNQQQMHVIGGNQPQMQTISVNQQQLQAMGGPQQIQTISVNQQGQQLQTIGGNQQQLQAVFGGNQQQLQTIIVSQPMQAIPCSQQQLQTIVVSQPIQSIPQQLQSFSGNQQFQAITGESQQGCGGQQLQANQQVCNGEQQQTENRHFAGLQQFQQSNGAVNQQSHSVLGQNNGVEQTTEQGCVDQPNGNSGEKEESPKGKKRTEKTPCEDDVPKKLRKKKKTEEMEAATVIMRLQRAAADDYPVELTNDKDEIINFDEKDLLVLLSRMEKLIPPGDTLTIRASIKKIDWKLVAFGEYSPFTCRETWNVISKKLRQHRVLMELISDAKEWTDKPWKNFFRIKPLANPNPTSNTHPDYPKKPMSSYLIYYHDRKGTVIKQNPGIKMYELTNLIATEYHSLSEEERNKYTERARQEKRLYERKVRAFYSKNPRVPRPERKVINKPQENKQKKHTPFNLYYEEQAKNVQPSERTVAFKEACKLMWKDLPEENKVYWIDKALDLEKQQTEDTPRKSVDESGIGGRPLLLKAERELKDKLAGKPVRPPVSAYGLFSRMILKGDEIKKFDSKERLRMIAVKWKDLPNEEKEQLRAQTTESMNEYKRQFDAYIKSLPPEKQQEELNKVSKKKINKTPDKNYTPKTEPVVPNNTENTRTHENIKSPEQFRNYETPQLEHLKTPTTENPVCKTENFVTPTSENIISPKIDNHVTPENVVKSEPLRQTPENPATSSPFVKEERIPEPPIKRERVETRHLIEAVIPFTWDDMADGERSVYIKYIEKIRHYFDTQHQSALQQMIKKEKCESD